MDTQNDMTGTQSYFTSFEEHQVMFHVSTMLPYSNEDIQQVFFALEESFHIIFERNLYEYKKIWNCRGYNMKIVKF